MLYIAAASINGCNCYAPTMAADDGGWRRCDDGGWPRTTAALVPFAASVLLYGKQFLQAVVGKRRT
jgi:hypothetical protein